MKPEIKAEWVAANKLKPDLKTFYDIEWDRGQKHDSSDFVIDTSVKVEDKMYTDYMQNYVLGFKGSLSGDQEF